jgi:hypothetical protein
MAQNTEPTTFGKGGFRYAEGGEDLLGALQRGREGRGDGAGRWLVVQSISSGDAIAAVRVTPAEASVLHVERNIPLPYLTKSLFIEEVLTGESAARSTPEEAHAAILYFAARAARIEGRTTLASFIEPTSKTASLLSLEPVNGVPTVGGRSLAAQRVDLAAHRAFSATASLRPLLEKGFVPEAVATLERWLAGFFGTSWFRAVKDGTLTRQQYVYTLANQHQYVRFTTRHIGAAVAYSEDRELRNHWRRHLEGEVDHERIIEKDLQGLGADVDFVLHHMVPQADNLKFCLAQEAILGFRRDPVLFLAPPFVAEGFSAHLDRAFMANLDRAAAGWGIANPRHVTNFIGSHIDFDGGDDGHWAGTLSVLERSLTTEKQLAEFLAVIRVCMDAFERSYCVFADDLAIFQARSA